MERMGHLQEAMSHHWLRFVTLRECNYMCNTDRSQALAVLHLQGEGHRTPCDTLCQLNILGISQISNEFDV